LCAENRDGYQRFSGRCVGGGDLAYHREIIDGAGAITVRIARGPVVRRWNSRPLREAGSASPTR
jgi:hypothetical protein